MNADSVTLLIHPAPAATIELSIPIADIEHHSGRYHTGWLKLIGAVVGDGYLATKRGDDAVLGLESDLRVSAGDTLHYVVQAPKPLPFNPTFWIATSNAHIHNIVSRTARETVAIVTNDPALEYAPKSEAALPSSSIVASAQDDPKLQARVSVKNRDKCCVLTGAPPYHCSSCHIVPEKNADNTEANMICACADLVGVHSAQEMILRDVRNRIYLNCGLHKAWDARNVLLLASDDRYVKSDYCEHQVATLWSREQLASRTSQIMGTAEAQPWMLFHQDVGPSRAGIDDGQMDEMRSWIGLSHNCHALFAKDVPPSNAPSREALHMMYGAQIILRYGKDMHEPARSPTPGPPTRVHHRPPGTVTAQTCLLPKSTGVETGPVALESTVVEWIEGVLPPE